MPTPKEVEIRDFIEKMEELTRENKLIMVRNASSVKRNIAEVIYFQSGARVKEAYEIKEDKE